jgi:hypothetical protein
MAVRWMNPSIMSTLRFGLRVSPQSVFVSFSTSIAHIHEAHSLRITNRPSARKDDDQTGEEVRTVVTHEMKEGRKGGEEESQTVWDGWNRSAGIDVDEFNSPAEHPSTHVPH